MKIFEISFSCQAKRIFSFQFNDTKNDESQKIGIQFLTCMVLLLRTKGKQIIVLPEKE